MDKAAELLSSLSIAGKKVDVDEMEWKFGGGLTRHLNPARTLDSDDDDDDETEGENPLKVLAEKEVPKSTVRHRKEERANRDEVRTN